MIATRQGWIARWIDACFSADELERIRSLPTRQNEYGYDPFGFNREDAKIAILIGRLLYRRYFRAQAFGVQHVRAGRVMLVANHSGQLPYDALNIAATVLFEASPARMVRTMVERYVPTMPYLSYLFARWGQVLGTPENGRRLLEADEAVLVFPEGVKGISKPFSQRYQLQPFGDGFIRLALLTGTPIVPVAVIGAEEQAPAVNVASLARLVRAPALPLIPVPPFLPLIPLPSRYYIYFGEPIDFAGDADDDDDRIDQRVQQVRMSIESMIRAGLKRRTSVFL